MARDPDRRLQSGELDRRIVIQQNVVLLVDGATTYTWTTLATVWARKIDTTGTERQASQVSTAFIDSLFVIRYVPGLMAQMRIQEFGTTFIWDIIAIAEIGRREGIELSCRRVIA
jgi:head-tail adaptor